MVILYNLNRDQGTHRHLHGQFTILQCNNFWPRVTWNSERVKLKPEVAIVVGCRIWTHFISFVDLYLEKKFVSFVVSKSHSRGILAFIQSIENHLHLWQGSFNRKFFRASYNLFRQFFFHLSLWCKSKPSWFLWLIKCSRILTI